MRNRMCHFSLSSCLFVCLFSIQTLLSILFLEWMEWETIHQLQKFICQAAQSFHLQRVPWHRVCLCAKDLQRAAEGWMPKLIKDWRSKVCWGAQNSLWVKRDTHVFTTSTLPPNSIQKGGWHSSSGEQKKTIPRMVRCVGVLSLFLINLLTMIIVDLNLHQVGHSSAAMDFEDDWSLRLAKMKTSTSSWSLSTDSSPLHANSKLFHMPWRPIEFRARRFLLYFHSFTAL